MDEKLYHPLFSRVGRKERKMKKRSNLKNPFNEPFGSILSGVLMLGFAVFMFWKVWDLPAALTLLFGREDVAPSVTADGTYHTDLLSPLVTVVLAVVCAGVLVVFLLRGLLALLGLFWRPAGRWVWKK